MRIAQMNDAMRRQAHTLAQANYEAEPAIECIYLFPSNEEVRLIEIDKTAGSHNDGGMVMPFYFGPDLASGLRFPSAIALISPEDVTTHQPPAGWGNWQEAEIIDKTSL